MKKFIALIVFLFLLYRTFRLQAQEQEPYYKCYKCLNDNLNCNRTCSGVQCVCRTFNSNGTILYNQGCLSSIHDIYEEPNVHYCKGNFCNDIKKWMNIDFIRMCLYILFPIFVFSSLFICWFIKRRRNMSKQFQLVSVVEDADENKDHAFPDIVVDETL